MHPLTRIPRRSFLQGVGTLVALPWLEALGAPTQPGSSVSPRRLAFVYIPNGANMADWTPQQTGVEYELPLILEPLRPFQGDVQVLSGLAHDKARANGDGAGDHARASATFLTGCQARKTAGADIRAGVSVDQIAAEQVGRSTRLPSLELSCDRARQAGNCDSGYSCAYQFNISWKTESTPMPPEVNPRVVFDRLFGGTNPAESGEARARRRLQRKSVLDFVADDARSLRTKLGRTDQRKLDEYLTAVRDLEVRIDRAEWAARTPENLVRPQDIPEDYGAHIRLMFDLLALAFQTDTTRVSTFLLAHDGSNRSYPWIGVPEGHHDISHHGNDEEKKAKIARINRFHMEQFAHFLSRLKSIPEGEGSLLDQCMIVYGGAIGDGNRHTHNNLPVLLCGGRGASLTAGRHLKLPRETPMTNLYLSLLERMGARAERVGDSTGRLDDV